MHFTNQHVQLEVFIKLCNLFIKMPDFENSELLELFKDALLEEPTYPCADTSEPHINFARFKLLVDLYQFIPNSHLSEKTKGKEQTTKGETELTAEHLKTFEMWSPKNLNNRVEEESLSTLTRSKHEDVISSVILSSTRSRTNKKQPSMVD